MWQTQILHTKWNLVSIVTCVRDTPTYRWKLVVYSLLCEKHTLHTITEWNKIFTVLCGTDTSSTYKVELGVPSRLCDRHPTAYAMQQREKSTPSAVRNIDKFKPIETSATVALLKWLYLYYIFYITPLYFPSSTSFECFAIIAKRPECLVKGQCGPIAASRVQYILEYLVAYKYVLIENNYLKMYSQTW